MSQPSVELRISPAPVDYREAEAAMEARVAAIRAGEAPELVWFLEHPPLYTAGTSAKDTDLLTPDRFPVFKTGRGGQYTYHGPGQRVIYALLDLKTRGEDVRCYVRDLEKWAIQALAALGVTGEIRPGRIGIWVERGPRGGRPPSEESRAIGALREDKIGAIGVRVRQWVSYHGIALNVNPDLSHFTGIVPCGITTHGVTSLQDLGKTAGMAELDKALIAAFEDVFKSSLREKAL